MKRNLGKIIVLGLFFLLVSCSIEQEEPNPIKTADCEYYFINEVEGTCGFDFDKVPYCIDCPDEEGKLGTYNILVDQPNDQFSEAVPLRPTILAVHGYLPNSSQPRDPYAGLSLPLMRDNFCKYGYNIAALEYRQDIKGFSAPVCDIPAEEIIRTHYRAIQDLRKAMDVLFQNPEAYGIDVDNFFLWGNSQGAMTILNGMFATNETEWLTTFPPEYQGIKDELGPWMPRHPVRGIIGIAGPIYNLDFIDPSDDIPLFLAHGVCDDVVPYKTGTYFNCPIETTAHGSYEIACRTKALGKPVTLYSINGLGHNYTDEINDFLSVAMRTWIKDQIICGEPKQEEFTIEANEVNCSSTNTSVQDCE